MSARISLSNGLRIAAVGVTAAFLSACGGHSGSGPLPATPSGGSSKTAQVKFHIVVPAPQKSTASGVRRPSYVSGSTASGTVTIGSTVVGTCTVVAGACNGTATAPIGSDTFVVSLYDAKTPPNLLSQGTKTQTIVAGTANTVNLTFNPVVANVAFSPAAFTLGTAGDATITVVAQDADGNEIIGPGSFIDASGNPLAFSAAITGGGGAVTIPTSGQTVTGPGGTITVHYSGAVPFYSGTVTPALSGSGTAPVFLSSPVATVSIAGTSYLGSSAVTGTPVGIALDPATAGKLWLAGEAGGIESFVASATAITGSGPFPVYVATDSKNGNLWFTDWGAGTTQPSPAKIYGVKAATNAVTAFPLPTAYVNAGTGYATATDFSASAPVGIIYDATNDAVWFAVRGWGSGGLKPSGTIQSAIGKLAPASSATPTFTFYAVNGNPYGLTQDASGKIWYSEDWGNALGSLDASVTPAVTHDYALGSGSAFADAAKGVAYDSTDGVVWVARQSSDELAEVDSGGNATIYQLPAGSEPKNIIDVANFAGAGHRIVFTENGTGKVGILDPAAASSVQGPTYVWPVTTGLTELTLPSGASPLGLVWDGTNLWVTDNTGNLLKITGF